VLHGLARMVAPACGEDAADVGRGRRSFQDAVGDEQQPIAGLERERLGVEGAVGHRAEGRVGAQGYLVDDAAAQAQRRRVPR
jgi:hypothetical protein